MAPSTSDERRRALRDAIARKQHELEEFERRRDVAKRSLEHLTAQLEALDGQHPIFKMQLGPARYVVDHRSSSAVSPTLPNSDRRVLAALRETASRDTIRLWAVRAPFEAKDELEARGYRWMPEPGRGIDRAWWTEVLHEKVDAELDWLRATVYRTAGGPTSRNAASPPTTGGAPTPATPRLPRR